MAAIASTVASVPDRYEIPIQSRSVSRLFVQSGFDIQMFDDGTETTIRIDNPIAVVTENPRPLVRLEDELIPAMGVYGRIVVSGSALRAARRMLDIIFHSGVWFQVEPRYEPDSWGPYGSKGLIVICMPGSEMAVWFGMKSRQTADATS
jgi:hypothetical protein